MNLLVLIDPETVFERDPEFSGADTEVCESMEFHIIHALRELGHTVSYLPFAPDPLAAARALLDAHPDLVFNLTEHFRGNRRHDANIAALLELLDIPFTGAGAEGLLLCRDKVTSKRLLGYHKIRLPHFFSVPRGTTRLPAHPHFPLMVKPAQEDGSDGISLASVVHDREELIARIRMIHERMNQEALCEEYIAGREIYVGITGNDRLTAYPAREIKFGHSGEGGPAIATARVKTDAAYREKWGITYEHADLPPPLEQKVSRISKRIFRILQMRDYGRIDLRLTETGDVVFIEANPNPNLCEGDDLAESALRTGLTHNALIDRIVKLALTRTRR
jgi:D-alanine-D-alanine ligase